METQALIELAAWSFAAGVLSTVAAIVYFGRTIAKVLNGIHDTAQLVRGFFVRRGSTKVPAGSRAPRSTKVLPELNAAQLDAVDCLTGLGMKKRQALAAVAPFRKHSTEQILRACISSRREVAA